jgi:hypothetical protein
VVHGKWTHTARGRSARKRLVLLAEVLGNDVNVNSGGCK